MKFTDTVAVAGTRRREDGYLVADARIARTGIQSYLGGEVGRPDMARVRVYRPGAEVFSRETLKSAAHRPVTNDHPPDLVTAENWKQHAVGQTGDEVRGEGIFLRVPLMVSDASAIRDIEAGKRELSAGYTCELDFTPGRTPSGEAYDAIQKNIRLNHVAIVARGRAGAEVRIGDGVPPGLPVGWGAAPHDEAGDQPTKETFAMTPKTVTVDGLSIAVSDEAAAAIDGLARRLAEADDRIAESAAAHLATLAERDAALAARDAEIEALRAGWPGMTNGGANGRANGTVEDTADINARAEARANVIAAARAIARDVRTDGLSDADIRRAVVAARLGEAAIAGRSAAYIDARFDILTEDAGRASADPFARVVAGGVHTHDSASIRDRAYAGMVSLLENAWKPATKGTS